MYKRNDHDRFSLFVFISIVIHIVVFVVIPFGNFSVMGNRGEIEEYGFLQIVEYESEITQPNSTIEETVDDVSPAEEAYTEPEAEPYIEEEPVIEEVIEEVSELDEIEDILEEETIDEPEETIEEDVNQNETELIDELVTADDQGSYIENQVENEHEIITSETGDIEISISESEEKGNAEENEKGVSGSDDEKTGAEQEISPPPPPPPPPPTAGDMILGAPVPAYPKDLVSQALTGKVELEVHVLNDGSIERVDILNSSGIDQMDRTAQLTLERGWSFKDYSQSYSIIIIVEYNINEEGNPDIKLIQREINFK